MKHRHLVLVVLTAALATACVSRPEKIEEPSEAVPPPVKAAPPAKESIKKVAPPPVEAELDKNAPGLKFSKLKVGMTLAQVEKAIGRPTKQWQHPTGKASIPFYFGPDRWVIQYSYKGEGVLTFNSGGEQLLTLIEINKTE